MALKKTFPAPTGAGINSVDSRADLAGLVTRTPAGAARSGILPRTSTALVAGRSSMAVDVAAFEAVLVRAGYGPAFIANDGTVTVPTAAAPGANKLIDLIWVRQRESQSPFADGDDLPVFGHTASAASATPTPDYASVPDGALVLASVEIPSTATTTLSVGVVITQLYPFTALTGSPIWFRTKAEMDAETGLPKYTRAVVLATDVTYQWSGAAWNIVEGGPIFQVGRGSAQAIGASSWTLVSAGYGTPGLDVGFTSFTSGVLTVAVTGWYDLRGSVLWPSPATTISHQFLVNSTTPDSSAMLDKAHRASGQSSESSKLVFLSAGDVVRMYVFSSSAQNLGSNPRDLAFSARYVRAA